MKSTEEVTEVTEVTEPEKVYYSWKEYQQDINFLANKLKGQDVHLVSIYRGSLVPGAHLSNILNAPLSVVKFQSYVDDKKTVKDKVVKKGVTVKIHKEQTLYIIDDIKDSGQTLEKVIHFYQTKGIQKKRIKVITLFWNPDFDKHPIEEDFDILSLNNSKGKWIVFPWEIEN